MKRIDRAMGGWLQKTVFDWSLWVTLALSFAVAFIGDEKTLRSASVEVGSTQVQIGTAFLGIVLAGLAILIVFLDEKYIALLEQVGSGFDADLWPFKYTAFIAVVCAAFGYTLMVLGNPTTLVFRLVFAFSLWSFSYLLLTMLDLVRFIAEHAKTRMKHIRNKNS
ncbi:MAG: hypothetical protein Q8O40_16585 [Chloroflexota bacterium]|nr:hypothetical protein [Chloroflexota bacterium]